MLRTLDRYVIRETLPPFLISLLVFTFILELPPIMDQLEHLVAKGVPWQTAGHIILLLAPQALGLTIPMALLVGLLIGLGRLSSDREAVALLACGVSPFRLLRPVLLLATAGTAATTYVMVVGIPDANQKFREITWDIISKKVETEVRPRVFFQDFPNLVLYPADEAPRGQPGWKNMIVADTRTPEALKFYMAERGVLLLDHDKREVSLVLTNGTQYSTRKEGQTETLRFPGDLISALDPNAVFPPSALPRGVTEKTIAELRETIADKTNNALSPHAEIMAIHAKFSIPAACFVFAVIALALGLTVTRDAKFSGFVVGIAVIFVYYVAMFLAESAAKGHQIPAEVARWVPNLLLGPIGIAALIWRAWYADVRSFRIPVRLPAFLQRRRQRADTDGAAHDGTRQIASPEGTIAGLRVDPQSGPQAPGGAGRRGVVVVLRVPRLTLPGPVLIDQYISGIYLRMVGLSFLGLLGLFYISTFIDRSDKIFKGQASGLMITELLIYMTPQFVYYIIPIAALLSVLVTVGLLTRSSELTVLKACGVSLYRAAAPLLVMSLGFSAVLFGLEQQVLARANRQAEILDSQIKNRPPRTFNALNRRWVVGRDGAIYYYGYFDHQRRELAGLTIYQPRQDRWALASRTFVQRAVHSDGAWHGERGWKQEFTGEVPTWKRFDRGILPGVEPPDYFATEQPVAEMMTVPQLRELIAELSASGFNVVPLSVELQKKLAFPFVTFVMTLLAVPFGVTTGKRGALYGIGLGIVIALSYWIVSGAFWAIGRAGMLHPILAGWAPNVLALGIAAYLLLKTRT